MRIGGLVVARQRPGTAKGIVFLLLEDEFGTVNLIVPPPVYERHRLLVRSEPLLIADGRLEKLPIAGGAINVFVDDLEPLVAPGEDARAWSRWPTRRDRGGAAEAPADRRAAARPTPSGSWPTSAASRPRSRASPRAAAVTAPTRAVRQRNLPPACGPRSSSSLVLVGLALGLGLLFVALSGGPSGARRAAAVAEPRAAGGVALVIFVLALLVLGHRRSRPR